MSEAWLSDQSWKKLIKEVDRVIECSSRDSFAYRKSEAFRNSLHQLNALEEPHDLQNTQDLDHAKDSLAVAHSGDILAILALLSR
jgi:hypothetical protein